MILVQLISALNLNISNAKHILHYDENAWYLVWIWGTAVKQNKRQLSQWNSSRVDFYGCQTYQTFQLDLFRMTSFFNLYSGKLILLFEWHLNPHEICFSTLGHLDSFKLRQDKIRRCCAGFFFQCNDDKRNKTLHTCVLSLILRPILLFHLLYEFRWSQSNKAERKIWKSKAQR